MNFELGQLLSQPGSFCQHQWHSLLLMFEQLLYNYNECKEHDYMKNDAGTARGESITWADPGACSKRPASAWAAGSQSRTGNTGWIRWIRIQIPEWPGLSERNQLDLNNELRCWHGGLPGCIRRDRYRFPCMFNTYTYCTIEVGQKREKSVSFACISRTKLGWTSKTCQDLGYLAVLLPPCWTSLGLIQAPVS